jgi:hypothetical protein
MPSIELSKKWYFTIFGNMTMTKGVFYHCLTPIRDFTQGQHFYQKSFILFKSLFFRFSQDYILLRRKTNLYR